MKKYFKYLIIGVVLLIPFIYSFFYLKAYWNPYGEGNIDNIPVAIVNLDDKDEGTELINSIKDSKKLKISVVSESVASKGLNNKEYYAVITIPKDFSSDLESVSNSERKHPTITYSPNQKSNFLASQIINNVVNEVEKKLDNKINSTIVDTLSSNLEGVPSKLDEIKEGFNDLENGTTKLQTGSKSLHTGVNTLYTSYNDFNNALKTLKEGLNTLNNETSKISSLSTNFAELNNGINELSTGSKTLNTGLNNYIENVNTSLDYSKNAATYIITMYELDPVNHANIPTELYQASKAMINNIDSLKKGGSTIQTGSENLENGLSTIEEKLTKLDTSNLSKLSESINKLATGATTIYNNSLKISTSLYTLNTASNTLKNGVSTLNNSVKDANKKLTNNIYDTKNDLKDIESLSDYSNNPVNIVTNNVNEVDNYGTAFAPFFISIALWVGCLMMLIVFYFDKENRFQKLGPDNPHLVKRTLYYHLLATIAGIILGILLSIFLDFNITNYLSYYLIIILVANLFMAIIEFFVINFNDIGKFIILILLVLQLAAAGGTFPIETVTSGFRWMNPLLPMTYSINLLKEPLISIENNLLTKNLIIVFVIFIVFFIINIIIDLIKQNNLKNNK